MGLFLTLSLVATACGDDDDDDAAGDSSPAATAGSTGVPSATAASPASSAPADTEADAAATVADTAAATTSAEADVEKEDITLTMGGSQASSSVFSLLVAESRIAGEADGAMTINIRETGASSENIQLLKDCAVDFGLSGLSTIIQAQRGIGAFAGNAYPGICNLMIYLKNAEIITVREDAGVDAIEDLEGKAFAPSFQGSALYDNVLAYLGVLGVSVDVFDGSLEDIVNAVKDGRIVGFGKSANGTGADASMLDVASTVDVKAVGFTQEQVDQILNASADNAVLYQFIEIPPGSIYDNEEAFLSSVVLASYFTDAATMDEETQYRLTKSMFEALQQAATETNYAGAMQVTAEDTVGNAGKLALCPGSERYFNEID